jgi:hypothetical protein
MARKFLSVSPHSGLLTTTTFEDGKHVVHYDQDVQAHLDLAARCRNERDPHFDRKDEIQHVAFVPDIVIMKMMTEDGVNFYDKADDKRVMQLIETKYPACKTTTKRIA